MKSGNCWACHQLGNKATREIPESLGSFPSSVAAWERRILSGQAGGSMASGMARLGARRAFEAFADWTDRVAAGELPPEPPRPQGLERNVVITQWDWADPKAYLHDQVSTDRRDPTVNANGLIYGALEASADYLPVLDPVNHTRSQVPLTVRDPNTPPAAVQTVPQPSPYWGDEAIWNSKNNVHNPMFDETGRVWITSAVRPPANPDFCKEGSDHPSAKLFPIERASRHLAVYDPKTEELTHISTCFSTHHLMFAEDENNTLWTSGGGQVVGWLDRKMFDETGDEVKSQGWTALIMDTNGNGKRDAYVEPDEPLDPAKDKRFGAAFYAVSPAPDGSVWGSVLGVPGAVVRLDPGTNPPETALAEVYEPPFNNPDAAVEGYSPRGMDVDRDGVAWAALASGHMASFDRRKCKGPLNGPKATGQHCPEGWTLYAEPLPQIQGVEDAGSAEGSYYTWVDQFDTFGLGEKHPDQHRQCVRRAAGSQGRRVDRSPGPLSAGVLHEMDGWPDRRCERGLEGQRPVDDSEHPRAVSHGGRQRDDEQGRALSASPRPAREVNGSRLIRSASNFRAKGWKRLGRPGRDGGVRPAHGHFGHFFAASAAFSSARAPPRMLVMA